MAQHGQVINDFYMQSPLTCLFIGKSMSYKTSILEELVKNFTHSVPGPPVAKIILIYEHWQPAYERMAAAAAPETEFESYHGFPREAYDNPGFFDCAGRCVVIADDQHWKLNNAKLADLLRKITQVYVHHKNLCFFMLLHELYSSSNRILTTLRRNANYLFLFQNTPQQLMVQLERDLYGTSSGILPKVADYAFNVCNSKYLCIDVNSRQKLKCGLLLSETPYLFVKND